MKALGLALFFAPDSLLAPLLALSGLFLIIGLRKLAWSLAALVLVSAISPMFEPVFAELFAALPWWFPLLLLGGLVVAFAGRALRDIFVNVASDLIASSIKWLVQSPRVLLSLLAGAGVLWLVFA